MILVYLTISTGNTAPKNRHTAEFKADSLRDIELYQQGVQADMRGDFQSALKAFLSQLDIREKMYGKDHLRLGRPYVLIGIEYKNIGKLNEAIDSYLKAEDLYINHLGKNTSRLGLVYANLGNIFKQKGNFSDAIKYHKQALVSYSNDRSSYEYQIHQNKFSICDDYFSMKQYNTALELIENNISTTDNELLWKYYDLRATIYNLTNDDEKANKDFQTAIRKQIKLNGDDHYLLGYSYLNYAQFLIKIEEFDAAKKYIELARPIILEQLGEKGIDAFDLYHTLADYYSKLTFDSKSLSDFRKKKIENLKLALKHYQDAIVSVASNFADIDPSRNPGMQQCAFQSQCLEALQNKSSAYYQMAQLSEGNKDDRFKYLASSLDAISIASDLLNKLRTEAVNEDSKILISELQNSTFIESINIAAELFVLTGGKEYFETAFHNAERGKAASLMDNLTEQSARDVSLIPDSLIEKEENINLQITFINEQIFEQSKYADTDPSVLAKYRSELFQLEKEKNDLNLQLETDYEEYYNLKYANDRLNLDELQQKLSNSEVILEYVFDTDDATNDNNIFLFFISKNDFHLKKLPLTETTLNDIDVLHNFLSDPNYINITKNKFKDYVNSAYSLYQVLISPIEELVNNRTITLIPDGKLSYIPFDALLYELPQSDRINFRTLSYLIKRHTFNYAYSTNLYINKISGKKKANNDLLAFAPSYEPNDNVTDEEFKSLSPLTGIVDEVNNIATHIDSKLLTGSEATESNFQELYQDYDVLHLAMHMLLNDSLPMFSKLAFSPPLVAANNDDGWLSTLEIYNLKLKARLAVLSACNTGSGILKKGEGVISLARGFFYAGCPSIIMTLWEIEDRSGTSIMDEFYRILSKGKKKHEALRLSKLNHIENADPLKAHPHYWLGYVTIGNTDAMYTSNDIYFFMIIFIIIIAVIIDQTIRHKKTRRKAGFQR